MTPEFETVSRIIKERRTIKAAAMNGQIIPDNTISQLLELADHAPTHGRTEPWRFFVYKGDALKKFCQDHAQLYWDNTAEENRKEQTFENLAHAGDMASHLVVAVMRRTPETKIPMMEEYAATAAAIQNLLLGAAASGLAAIWNTGGMALKQPMKTYLGLAAEDIVTGLLYLGYTDQPLKEAVRNISLEQKVVWA